MSDKKENPLITQLKTARGMIEHWGGVQEKLNQQFANGEISHEELLKKSKIPAKHIKEWEETTNNLLDQMNKKKGRTP